MCDFREAKARRELIAPLFSRRALLELEVFVRDKVPYLTHTP